jgi:hypothetical protein
MVERMPHYLIEASLNRISLSQVREEDVEVWFEMIDAKITDANDYENRCRSKSNFAVQRQREAQARAHEITQRLTKP